MLAKRLSLALVWTAAAAAGLALSGCGGGSTGSGTAGPSGAGLAALPPTTLSRQAPAPAAFGRQSSGPAVPAPATQGPTTQGPATQGQATQGPATPGRTEQDPPAALAEALADPVTAGEVADAIGRAVEAEGAQGSVNQSSNVDADGVTTGRVSVVAQHGAGSPRFALRNDGRWSIGSDDGAPARFGTERGLTGWSGVALIKRIAGGTLYVDAYTDIEPPVTVEGTGGTHASFTFTEFDGNLTLTVSDLDRFDFAAELDGVAGRATCSGCSFAYTPGQLRMTGGSMTFTPDDGSGPTTLGTDARVDPDLDYLAGGTWLFVPDDASADHGYGAFADGSDPFEQSGFAGLTGEATYDGVAYGTRTVESGGTVDVGRLFATATLRVHFERDEGDGPFAEIAGWLTGVHVDGVPLSQQFVINLRGARIGTEHSGFFTGETDVGGGYDPVREPPIDYPHRGKWSGQFFGNGQPDGKPGSVAGTFGAKTEDGTENYFGMFGAERREE